MCESNDNAIHLELIQCYMSIVSQYNYKRKENYSNPTLCLVYTLWKATILLQISTSKKNTIHGTLARK